MKTIYILSLLNPSQGFRSCRLSEDTFCWIQTGVDGRSPVHQRGYHTMTGEIHVIRKFGVTTPLQISTSPYLWENLQEVEKVKKMPNKEYTKRNLIRNVFMSGNILCHFPMCFWFYTLSPVCLLMQNNAREHPENSTNLTCLFSYFIKQTCKYLCVD